ncbi:MULTISPECIES: CopG family transcriptional regulator [unclassified Rickettsia]|uniref:ribbon-helix-helix domain-containing protein n=1 Tax=unclassified Rickettsia TaxID=114295 RepID=UPI00209F15F9|nr:CopG family transcriptional regulator [Rickettsia endosymbiont of Ceutorhynchus assimilis]
MRTIIDIPDTQIKILDQLSQKKKISRAQIVRQAVTNYITDYTESKKSYESAFGIWKDKKLDSLTYQSKLREEWKK